MTGINLPPALAARRAELEDSASCSRSQSVECLRVAALYVAEIAGIDAAAEAFAELLAHATGERVAREEQEQPASAMAGPPKQRRERRSIRGMVAQTIRDSQSTGCRATEIAERLADVRPGQISSALTWYERTNQIRHDPDDRWRLAIVPAPTGDPDVLADELALRAPG